MQEYENENRSVDGIENTDSEEKTEVQFTPENNGGSSYEDTHAPAQSYGAVYTPYGTNGGYSYTPYVSQNGNMYSGQTQNFGGNMNNITSAPAAGKKKKKNSGSKTALIAVLLVACIVLSGVSAYFGTVLARRHTELPSGDTGEHSGILSDGEKNSTTVNVADLQNIGVETNKVQRGELMTIPQTVTEVKDSVVEITTESVTQGYGFFSQYVTSGAGSGVILSEEGFIITNNHVIEDATTITVRLTDGKEYPAVLVGTDVDSDVAVIKIAPDKDEKLKCAVIGNSDLLVVGEGIIVIGNPLGELGGTVTDGIISAKEREVTVSNETMTLLQTNAAVNPGNSGGGMFNLYGELVGVINAKSSGDNVEGLGFAIPVNVAWSVAEELIDFGYVRGKPTLGITVMDVTNQSYARYYFNSYSTGVYIYEAEKDSGFEYGDRIISFNGTEITSTADLTAQLKKSSVGDEVTVVVMRGGKTVEKKAKLKERVPETTKG